MACNNCADDSPRTVCEHCIDLQELILEIETAVEIQLPFFDMYGGDAVYPERGDR